MTGGTFTDCKTAQLQWTAQIQPSGALIAVDKHTGRIRASSANTLPFTGLPPEELLGQTWSVLLTREQAEEVFTPCGAAGTGLTQIGPAEFNSQRVLIASHSSGDAAIFEIERFTQDSPPSRFREIAAYLEALAATRTPEAAAELLMHTIARVISFSRVMLYRFLPGWHGEVIAETVRPGIEGYLGLRFPEGDIPANARRLYLLNWKRAIADVDAVPEPILTAPGCGLLDLTYSQLRAVHPVHIQYLKNIGTKASFSVSIVTGGELWGLIACHNMTARQIPFDVEAFCEQLSRMASMHVADLNSARLEKARAAYREAQAETKGALKGQDRDIRSIATQLAPIRRIFMAQGLWACLNGQEFCNGDLPEGPDRDALRSWLETQDASSVAAYSAIPPELASNESLTRHASGALYIPLSEGDFLALMRPEQAETVNWAGKPQSFSADPGAPHTPRSSFQQWTQLVRGTSEPWQEADIEAAGRLRELLLEYGEEIRLESLALHDPLTGLANRHLFGRKLNEAIRSSIQSGHSAAVYMLDLDKFKPVNDVMGHAAGDELLTQAASRLKAAVRSRDVVARLGGDEFAIVQFHLHDAKDAAATAEKILQEIRRPFCIQDQDVQIGVSIGVAICPAHGVEDRELVHAADLALYQSKAAGRDCFRIFTSGIRAEQAHSETARQSLVRALENGEFALVYQPIVSAGSRTVRAFEAFARWRHPEKGLLHAAAFKPLIEQHRMQMPFAEWGVRELIRQGARWRRNGLTLLPVSLNLTTAQFFNLDLVGLCASLSAEYGIGLDWLCFDADEAVLHSSPARAADRIAALAKIGVRTNIDHFGEGAVALKQLAGLKICQLKMPARLLGEGTNARKGGFAAIIKSVAAMLGAQTVVTGIEDAAAEERAVSAGIDLLQGYGICRCLELEGVERTMKEPCRLPAQLE